MRPYFLLGLALGLWGLLPRSIQGQCELSASSSGANPAYTQVYILSDELGLVLATNATGQFIAPRAGTYRIHALNYDPANPPAPLPDALIGQNLALLGTQQAGCFNADVLTDYVSRYCGACQGRRQLCANEPLTVSSSGASLGYTQLYILSNADGSQVLALNGTGNFGTLAQAGQSYRVYALNYNPADPPQPIPLPGQALNSLGSQYQGCYNPDFFYDYLCVDVVNCPENCFQERPVCPGQDLVASSRNDNKAYTQVYVLSDDNDQFIAQNSTGVFSSLGLVDGARYRIRALNYNPAEPPNPLPAAWLPGQALSLPNQGCFNDDFMADFTCLRLSCVILQQNHLDLRGYALAEGNRLNWELGQALQAGQSLRLERSTRPERGFETLAEWTWGENPPKTFLDEQAPNQAYYRLVRQQNSGQNRLYSALVYLQNSTKTKPPQLYPNPSSGLCQLSLELPKAQSIQLRLYNAWGQALRAWSPELAAGAQNLPLQLQDLGAGLYLLELDLGQGEITTFKLLIQ